MTQEKLKPTKKLRVNELFKIDSDMEIYGYEEPDEYVPEIDPDYVFDKDTVLAICAGFAYNQRVFITGYHGTGKSTHIEQVAARLNWPCIRVNLDAHISRVDLIGKDVITTQNGSPITVFKDGILPWSLKRNVCLVFDEYDAARPDVMFVIQRILEKSGKLTLLDQNEVITPHSSFRMFATANTVGLGDTTGLYHGTQQINQGQMDRWNIVSILNYLPREVEEEIIRKKSPHMQNDRAMIGRMVATAALTRESMKNGALSTVMSPRTVITWAENYRYFSDIDMAFRFCFFNKCDEDEKNTVREIYQRSMGYDLPMPEGPTSYQTD